MQVMSTSDAIEQHGREVRFNWRVAEDHTSAVTWVEISLIGDRAWHRRAGTDGTVNFRYLVLPR
jgi:hypothetical protein